MCPTHSCLSIQDLSHLLAHALQRTGAKVRCCGALPGDLAAGQFINAIAFNVSTQGLKTVCHVLGLIVVNRA